MRMLSTPKLILFFCQNRLTLSTVMLYYKNSKRAHTIKRTAQMRIRRDLPGMDVEGARTVLSCKKTTL